MAKGKKTGGLVAVPFEHRLVRNDETGCLEWTGYKTKLGYGQLSVGGVQKYAHRHAYELAKGEVPHGNSVCHSCDNPACCNPDHLWLGTHRQNMNDRTSKGRVTQGERHWNARFTEDDVKEMRRLHASGARTVEIALQFKTADCTVLDIVKRRRWKRVT